MTEAAEKRRPRQHGQPDLSQRRRSCRRRARSCCRARSARSSMSRRATCRAGWSARPGATGAPRPVAVAPVSTKHGSNGVLGDIGIHILDFASYGAGLDIDHVFCRLKTFDKAPGNKIGEYDLDANDSFTMSVDFTNGALGVDPRHAAGPPATSTSCACASMARRAASRCSHRHDGSRCASASATTPRPAPGRDRGRAGADQLPALRRGGGAGKTRSRPSATPPTCRRCSTPRWSRTAAGGSRWSER